MGSLACENHLISQGPVAKKPYGGTMLEETLLPYAHSSRCICAYAQMYGSVPTNVVAERSILPTKEAYCGVSGWLTPTNHFKPKRIGWRIRTSEVQETGAANGSLDARIASRGVSLRQWRILIVGTVTGAVAVDM